MTPRRDAALRSFRATSVKGIDTWTETLLIDRPASLIAFCLIRIGVRGRRAPYVATLLSFLLRVCSAVLLWQGYLVGAATSFFFAMVADSVDGNLSRAIFGRDPELRGTLDVAFDWLGAGLLLLALHARFLELDDRAGAAAVIGIALLLVLTEFAIATKFRLCAKTGVDPDAPSLTVEGEIDPRSGPFVRRLTTVKRAFARRRLIMVPSMVDGEFVLFVVGPFVDFHPAVVVTAIVVFGVVTAANAVMASLLLRRLPDTG